MTVEEEIDELAHILPSFDFFNRYYLNVPVHQHFPSYEEIDGPSLHRPSLASFDSVSEFDDPLIDGVGNGITNVSIDNLHKLPEVNSPFTVEIHVTPNAPKFGEPMESPNFLKEYTCGDVVHGMVLIRNNSDKPMTFEMFYVMLEGTVVVVDRTQKTRSAKNILRMADMGASWAQFYVEPSVSMDQCFGKFDPCDKTTLGFPPDKILQPNGCHKKFFSFKIPDQLLESQCPHGMSEHFSLPPSIGVDKHRKGCNFRDLKINRQLGYGRAETRGGPIWADDLADDDVCVNYSVKAILVGRNNKTKELFNMRHAEYSIRVIPKTLEMISRQKMGCSSELESLIREAESSISKLELVKRKYDEKGFVTSEDLESDVSMLKEVQLRSLSKIFDANLEKTSGTLEMGLVYKVEPKWTDRFINSPQQKAGIIIGRVRTPHVVLPYRPPILIDYRNRFEIKTKHERENARRLSQISGNALEDLETELECKPANNSDGKPPGIKSISAELISVTGMSKRDIPIRLSNKTLLHERDEIRAKFKEYGKCLDDLQSWYKHCSDNIEPPLKQIVRETLRADVLGMESLQVKVNHVPLLVTQIDSTDWNSELQRCLTVNLKQPPFKSGVSGPIIPPSFVSCMCFRSYTVRLKIQMDHGVGLLQLDVPIEVRNVTARSDQINPC